MSGTSATIPGLTANTLYQVQVRATNSDGNGPWSPSGSGQTNSAGNSAPTFPSSTATRSVAENSPASTDVGAPVTAADIDSGDTLTYTLEGLAWHRRRLVLDRLDQRPDPHEVRRYLRLRGARPPTR